MAPHVIGFKFAAWLGWDAWRALAPADLQAKWVARKLLRGPFKDFDPVRAAPAGELHVQMPWGSYRVVDRSGRVERVAGVVIPCGGP